ncbi:hypothetical protein BH09PAT4_BH09PAT4_01380 [soil metagenome]
MSVFEKAHDVFQPGSEHSLYSNAALIGSVVVGEVILASEAPQLFDFGFIAGCVVAVPALGRIVETVRPGYRSGENEE